MTNKPGVYLKAPDDFADLGKGMSVKAVCRKWGVGMTVAQRWRQEAGFVTGKSCAFKHMPDDFPEAAKAMSVKAICHKWSISDDTARRWRKEAGFGRPSKMPALSPQQLQHLADAMTLKEAAAQYGISDRSMSKLYRAAGVIHKQKRSGRVVALKRAPARPPVIHSAIAQYAKDWIQREEPIWRCREDGAYDYAGAWFRFRGRVWDGTALVQKARDMGWKPELAWSVAA